MHNDGARSGVWNEDPGFGFVVAAVELKSRRIMAAVSRVYGGYAR
jgi:hypothetical protein